jgi:hypothetical protein
MKTTSMTLLTSALLSISSFAVADSATVIEIETTETTNANRVYVGPEFMWSHYNDKVDKVPCDFSLKQNVYYGGLRFGYEYLKPQAYYANTDVLLALGSDHASIIQEKNEIKEDRNLGAHIKEAFKGHRGHSWVNIEQRLGYTFASSLIPSCTVSLYGAPGYHFEHVKGDTAHWWYAAAGLKTLQQFTNHFHLGCDLKVMYAFNAHEHGFLTLPTTLGREEFWGYEVGVPLEWTIGACNTFDVQLKPYLLKLNVNSQETILGARLELGYNY